MTKREVVQEKTEIDSAVIPLLKPQNESKPGLSDDHPLNDIIGTHEGPVWEMILKNIQRNRKRADKEYAKEIK